jgi:hypothetical protein
LICLVAACSSSGAPPGAAQDGAPPDGASSDLASDPASPNDGEVAPAACGVARAAAPALPGSRDPKVLARAAVVVGSCIADDGIDRNLDAMWASIVNHARYWDRLALQADCLAGSKCGCGAVETCIGFEAKEGAAAAAPKCSGSTFSLCEEASPGRFACVNVDCAAVGLTCDPDALCSRPPNTTCGAADCAAVGLTCAADQCVGGGAACSGGAASPEGDFRPEGLSCSGAMMDACVGGKRATLDCSKLGPGFACQTVSGQFFCGLGSECLPGNAGPTAVKCEGNTVVFCNAGRVDRVDCKSLGFTGCDIDTAHGHYGCIPAP